MSKLLKTIGKQIAGVAALAFVFWLYLVFFTREQCLDSPTGLFRRAAA